jgi:hypothetical protein
VDDLVYTGDLDLVKEFEKQLKDKWKVSQSERLKSFLGINIDYAEDRSTLDFDVTEKIKKIFEEKDWLKDIGLSNLPMLHSPRKIKCATPEAYDMICKKLSDAKTYASVVGACIYISITCRPDITQTVGRVSRAMHNPTPAHIDQVITLLQYLNSTRNFKLRYTRTDQPVQDQLIDLSKADPDLPQLIISHHDPSKSISGTDVYGLSDADYSTP